MLTVYIKWFTGCIRTLTYIYILTFKFHVYRHDIVHNKLLAWVAYKKYKPTFF